MANSAPIRNGDECTITTAIAVDHQALLHQSNPRMKGHCPGCRGRFDVSDLPPLSKFNCPKCGKKLLVPRQVERWLLERRLGAGGVATAYQAFDPTQNCRVALKLFDKAALNALACSRTRLNPALRNLGLLSACPSVVPVISSGAISGRPFVATRLMEGGSLAAWLQAHPGGLDLEHAIVILQSCCIALDYALRQEMMHENVAPTNILITDKGEVKLADFGLAVQFWDPDLPPIENAAACFANPQYACPELVLYGRQDQRGDVFSLGVVLYEMLTGEAPFAALRTGDTGTLAAYFQPVPAPKECRPDVPEALSQLAMDMIRTKPEERPEDYAAILGRLKDAGLLRTSATGTTSITLESIVSRAKKQAGAAGPAKTPATPGAQVETPSGRWQGVPRIVAFVAVGFLLGLFVIWLLTKLFGHRP